MNYLFISLITFFGGLLQAVTGFGAGIFNMLFLPGLLPMAVAAAVSDSICISLSASIAYHYKKAIHYKIIIVPMMVNILVTTIAVKLTTIINLDSWKPILGILLVLLAVFFLRFSDKVHVKGNMASIAICCGFSALVGTLFGIGGPLMVIYFLSITDSKEEYLGTINASFTIAMLYQTIMRIAVGVLTTEHIPMILVGTAAVLIGRYMGSRIADKIDGEKLKKLVYIFIAIAGMVIIFQTL